MATKQINQLTVATAIEDTDSIPCQTIGGVTKKFTPAELKTNLDGRYQQLGEVKWENASGATSGSYTVAYDHTYIFYTNINSDNSDNVYGKQILNAVSGENDSIAVSIFNINELTYGHSRISFSHLGFTAYSSAGYALKVYKVIDMGVVQ